MSRPSAIPSLGRPGAAALLALGLWAAGACRGARDAAHEERRRESQEVRRLAEEAGRIAAGREGGRHGDHPRAARDTGTRFALGGDGMGIARGDDPPLGAGDVRVTSTDGALVLAVIGDTVRARIGDSVVRKVRREMEADASGDTAGLGGFVARTVKGAVSGAMSAAAHFALRAPVAQVRDVRYEDGQLSFRTGKDDRTSARFSPADAERFMAAVRARQQRPAGR